MKNYYTSILLLSVLFLPVVMQAQPYQPFPTGAASWQAVRCWYFYPGGWHDGYTLYQDGSDTTINGNIFKKTYLMGHHAPGTAFDSVYTVPLGGMRETNKQVFIVDSYHAGDTLERLVYDFNPVNVGDTIFTQAVLYGFTNFIGHLVTAIDSVLIGSQYHKRLHLQDPSTIYNLETWTEGVGSSWGVTYASYWTITDNSYDLTCFYNGNVLHYANPSPGYEYCQSPLPVIVCDSLLSGTNEIESNSVIQLYPNPASDKFFVSNFSDKKITGIRISDLTGRTVSVSDSPVQPGEIDIAQLQSGIYFVQLFSFHKIIFTGKIVKM